MLLSYKFRLYPNHQQRQNLSRILDVHRQIYNDALQERREAWRKCGVSIRYNDQANQLKEIRSFDSDAAWCNYSSLQQTLRRLNKAFDAFFRRLKAGEKPGYPRFKGKGWFKSVSYVYGDGLRLHGDRLYVQNIGQVRMFLHREIPADGVIKMAILKQDRLGNWFVIFQVELPDPAMPVRQLPEVGIDMGLEHFATLSTGEQVENPRRFRHAEDKLGILQKKRARCKRGSNRYRELTRRIRRFHQLVANKRRDFHHQISASLVHRYGWIAIEDLNIKGLFQGRTSKSMGDAGWSRFLQMLEYKAAWAGTSVIKVEANGTSQECSRCGFVIPKSLSERWHHCTNCAFTAPRDVNAALVILSRGRARTGPPRKGLPEPVMVEVAGSHLL